MTSDNKKDTLLTGILELLSSCNGNHMKELLETVLNSVMESERDQVLQASP